jgi:hypothetical protein
VVKTFNGNNQDHTMFHMVKLTGTDHEHCIAALATKKNVYTLKPHNLRDCQRKFQYNINFVITVKFNTQLAQSKIIN